jgi:glutathionyl-hydroquinone reductase
MNWFGEAFRTESMSSVSSQRDIDIGAAQTSRYVVRVSLQCLFEQAHRALLVARLRSISPLT